MPEKEKKKRVEGERRSSVCREWQKKKVSGASGPGMASASALGAETTFGGRIARRALERRKSRLKGGGVRLRQLGRINLIQKYGREEGNGEGGGGGVQEGEGGERITETDGFHKRTRSTKIQNDKCNSHKRKQKETQSVKYKRKVSSIVSERT